MYRIFILLLWGVSAFSAAGEVEHRALSHPEKGVLCDRFFCADAQGVSKALTARFLGTKAAERLFSQGDFDLSRFTFTNNIYCDTQEKVCRVGRYFGADGQPSGTVSEKYTAILFGHVQ
ncbi:hypothetical protein EH228_11710 [Erwinia endophytica]|uniref:YcgJ family protein n=1 Tax=Erwinia endophytica TaxID=1563158 RepID=UPI001265F7D8|nr:YcgJ family protein [Erwinia endophytica]KAB8310159.1 hypothetical protein EH228_11710 [Erwinia endophytica]